MWRVAHLSPDDVQAYRQLWHRIRLQLHQVEERLETETEPAQQWQLLRRLLKLRKLARAIRQRYPAV